MERMLVVYNSLFCCKLLGTMEGISVLDWVIVVYFTVNSWRLLEGILVVYNYTVL